MTFREEIIGDARLILGDCREIIQALDPADVVMTDPPYEKHMHESKSGCLGIRTDGYDSPAPLDFASVAGIREQITPLMVAKCRKWLLAFCTPEGVAAWRDAIEATGARYKRACVLYKPDSAPQFNGQGPAIAAEMFVTAWCGTGHSRWNGGGRRNVFIYPTNGSTREGTHPTEKPLALMCELVTLFSDPGDTILDPFMGSGTTGVACRKLGRPFVGIEKIQRYFDVACRRIEAAARQPDMFIERPKPAPQADLLDYDPQRDFAGSLEEGYRAIRARVAAGGPKWIPGEPKT